MKLTSRLAAVALIAALQTLPMKVDADTGSVPFIQPATPAIRQAWVRMETQRWVHSFIGTPSPDLVEQESTRLTSLEAGTELYEIPGVFVDDGPNTFAIDSATVVEIPSGYDVYRFGKFYRHFSADVKLTHVPALLVYFVNPGHTPSKFLWNRRPSAIAP